MDNYGSKQFYLLQQQELKLYSYNKNLIKDYNLEEQEKPEYAQ